MVKSEKDGVEQNKKKNTKVEQIIIIEYESVFKLKEKHNHDEYNMVKLLHTEINGVGT